MLLTPHSWVGLVRLKIMLNIRVSYTAVESVSSWAALMYVDLLQYTAQGGV